MTSVGVLESVKFQKKKKTEKKTNKCLTEDFGRNKSAGPFLAPNITTVIIIINIVMCVILTATVIVIIFCSILL